MNDTEFLHTLPACDILMQLDNMLEGGLENVVIDLVRALEGWGYSVAILVFGATGEGARKAMRDGLRVCVFPYSEQALQQELERNRPEMVFAHYSFQGVHVYKSLGIPFMQVLHNVYIWFDDARKEMFAKAAAHTTLFVAVSETVKEYSVECLGVPEEKCLVIPNGIDLSKFTPKAKQETIDMRKRMGFSYEDFLFIAVASVNRIKRILAIVKSFHCIRDLIPRARLMLLGYPYDEGYLNEILGYIDRNGLQEHVRCVGHSTTPELYYLMGDAFVHASIYEGGQLVLLESLAANLAVVTTDVGFARHFAPYPAIRVIDRDFPYTYESFANRNAEAFYPSTRLVADLAWAMLQTYRNGIRPNLPQELIKAFDVTQTYVCYEQLIANMLVRPPHTEPVAGWLDLLPEPPTEGNNVEDDTARSIIQYEAIVDELNSTLAVKDAQIAERDAALAVKNTQIAELDESLAVKDAQIAERDAALLSRDAQLESVFQSKSWKITIPLRAVIRIIRHLLRLS